MLLNYPRLLIHGQDTSTTPCVVSASNICVLFISFVVFIV
jgi:hypothetical protein